MNSLQSENGRKGKRRGVYMLKSKLGVVLAVKCIGLSFISGSCFAKLPKTWTPLSPVLVARMEQSTLKMKLSEDDVNGIITYLNNMQAPTPELVKLQAKLPKTALELLRAAQSRGVDLSEAENMATYLYGLVDKFQFKHINKFDENTSHIIGREWQEIDYSGENMTWEKQQLKYQPYGIVNFKSRAQLERFFPIESKLSYLLKFMSRKSKCFNSLILILFKIRDQFLLSTFFNIYFINSFLHA